MRRILFIAPSAYRLGGVQTWLDYMLSGLSVSGFDVHLGLVEGALHDPDAYLEQHPFPTVHRVRARQFTPRSRQMAIAALVNRLQPDALIGVNIVDGYLSRRFFDRSAARKCRVIATNHALQPDFYADFKRFSQGIDAIICTNRLSTALCGPLSDFGDQRIFYAPYGVPEASLSRSGTRGRNLVVGYVGRIATEQKEVFEVAKIGAAARRAGLEFELLVAGTGPQEAEFRSLIAELGLDERTEMLGHVPADELPEKAYSRIDVLLITSSWETGPIVAWEAMAHGVAVLTSEYVGLKAENSLVDGVNCHIFPQGDIESAARMLRDLDSAEARSKIVSSGHELIRERYSRRSSVQQWAKCIEAACNLPVKQCDDMRVEPSARGRLESIMGETLGASLRALFGRKPEARGPGAEWPHGYSRAEDKDTFWKCAKEADRRDIGSGA